MRIALTGSSGKLGTVVGRELRAHGHDVIGMDAVGTGYIDARDGAQAIERALTTAAPGFDQFIIAAADTVMSRPNADLIAEVFPGVPVTREVGANETLLSIDKARRVLGYDPKHSWRDHA